MVLKILLVELVLIIHVYGSKVCKYSETLSGGATYHMYNAETPMNSVACQLPMVFNKKTGELRVTATNQFEGMTKGLVCGDCIRVRNVESNKSIMCQIVAPD